MSIRTMSGLCIAILRASPETLPITETSTSPDSFKASTIAKARSWFCSTTTTVRCCFIGTQVRPNFIDRNSKATEHYIKLPVCLFFQHTFTFNGMPAQFIYMPPKKSGISAGVAQLIGPLDFHLGQSLDLTGRNAISSTMRNRRSALTARTTLFRDRSECPDSRPMSKLAMYALDCELPDASAACL